MGKPGPGPHRAAGACRLRTVLLHARNDPRGLRGLPRERGVVQQQFDPMALWRAQCAGKVSGRAMPAGHFIPEELPEETARALGEFFGG